MRSIELLEPSFSELKVRRCPRRGSADMDGLRGRPWARKLARSARIEVQRGSVSAHSRAGGCTYPSRTDGSARSRSPRWRTTIVQRAVADAAERDRRGGLPRRIVWVSIGARHARRAGRALRRHPQGKKVSIYRTLTSDRSSMMINLNGCPSFWSIESATGAIIRADPGDQWCSSALVRSSRWKSGQVRRGRADR